MIRYRRDLRADEVSQYVQNPKPTILEIGCNDGTDTNKLLEAFPAARIFCFEPDPRAIKRFKETVHCDRAVLIQAAISDIDSRTIFNGSSGRPPRSCRDKNHYCQLDEWDLSGSLCKPTGHLEYSPWVTFPENRRFEVKTLQLDTWFLSRDDIEAVDFIWADVQGAEALLIGGAQETLKRTKYFYTEYYDPEMYEGQPNLQRMQEMLSTFELIARYGKSNVLFKHREF